MKKSFITIITIIVLFIFSQLAVSQEIKNLALTPPMGWNSWNWFGKTTINERIVTEVIDAMVKEV